MLTIDDCNTILQKYGVTGFWYEIDFSKFWDGASNKSWKYDFGTITAQYYSSIHAWRVIVRVNNSLSCKVAYVQHQDGSYVSCSWVDSGNYFIFSAYYQTPKMYIYLTSSEVTFPDTYEIYSYMFIPLSSLSIPVINGVYDDKWYFKKLTIQPGTFLINGEPTTVYSDSKGTYLKLDSGVDSEIGFKQRQSGKTFTPYTIRFREFKTLPVLSIPRLYRGTPQKLTLINNETQEQITEFQAYYQGRLLKDNIINLSFDAPDYIDVTIDMLSPDYVNSTVKLKAQTELYTASTQSEVETAINEGIMTLQIKDNEDSVLLNNIELTDIALINSNILLSESTLTDCTFLDTSYMDKGDNTLNNTSFNNVTITSDSTTSTYADCTLTDCTVTGTELHITGTLTNNLFNNSLIISDGELQITGNTFNGVGSKTYFPSHLYLTGDYTITDNNFNLTGEWETLAFNMCIIKATQDFNQSEFIKQNLFNLNITYEDEPTDTLYYNIVDDDKIRAVRLN